MLRYVEQRLFEGGIPSKSTMLLVKEDFRLAGGLMSMSITQDGQAPNFLASAVFKYLSDTLDFNEIDSDKHRQFCGNVSSSNLFLQIPWIRAETISILGKFFIYSILLYFSFSFRY